MHCSSCGARLVDDARFCPSCGTAVGPAVAPPMQGQEPDLLDVRLVELPIKKIPLIKAIRGQTKMSLAVAKQVAESGGRLGVSLTAEQAEQFVQALKKAGAGVEIVAADEPVGDEDLGSGDPRIQERLFHTLRGRVKKAILQTIGAAEPVKVVVRGAHGQAMVGTDSRVIVCKPGWMAGATLGAEVTSWQYRNLAGVQVHKGIVSGSVILQAPAQSGTKTSYWGRGKDDPSKAPNAIPIAGGWEEVRKAVAELQRLLDEAHRPQPQPAPPGPAAMSASLADELEKLASLHASGVLDEDEFKAAKQRLLDQT